MPVLLLTSSPLSTAFPAIESDANASSQSYTQFSKPPINCTCIPGPQATAECTDVRAHPPVSFHSLFSRQICDYANHFQRKAEARGHSLYIVQRQKLELACWIYRISLLQWNCTFLFSRQRVHQLSLTPWSYLMVFYSVSTLISSHGLQWDDA